MKISEVPSVKGKWNSLQSNTKKESWILFTSFNMERITVRVKTEIFKELNKNYKLYLEKKHGKGHQKNIVKKRSNDEWAGGN